MNNTAIFRFFFVAVFFAGIAISAHPTENESTSSYVKAEVRIFIQRQLIIRNEIKDGIFRLQGSCKKKASGSNAALTDEQRVVSARIIEIRQRITAAENVAETRTRDYVQILQNSKNERCNALKNFFSNRSNNESNEVLVCEKLSKELKAAEEIRELFLEYQTISRSRLELFQEMLKLEARECARPGFTARVLSIYELSNLSSEIYVGEFFNTQINKLRETFATPPRVER